MKVEVIKEQPVPPPPVVKEFVLRLSVNEMKAVMEVANNNGFRKQAESYRYYTKSDREIHDVFNAIWHSIPVHVKDEVLSK